MSGHNYASFGWGRGSVSQAPAVTHRSAPLIHRRAPPCPRSQGHSPQVKSALFVFVFQSVGPPHAHSGVVVSCLRFAQGGLRPQGGNLNSGGYREAIRALFQGEGPQQRGHLPVGETGGLPDG